MTINVLLLTSTQLSNFIEERGEHTWIKFAIWRLDCIVFSVSTLHWLKWRQPWWAVSTKGPVIFSVARRFGYYLLGSFAVTFDIANYLIKSWWTWDFYWYYTKKINKNVKLKARPRFRFSVTWSQQIGSARCANSAVLCCTIIQWMQSLLHEINKYTANILHLSTCVLYWI